MEDPDVKRDLLARLCDVLSDDAILCHHHLVAVDRGARRPRRTARSASAASTCSTRSRRWTSWSWPPGRGDRGDPHSHERSVHRAGQERRRGARHPGVRGEPAAVPLPVRGGAAGGRGRPRARGRGRVHEDGRRAIRWARWRCWTSWAWTWPWRSASQIGAEVPARVRELVAAGRLGRKSGAGFYEYRARRPGARPAACAVRGHVPDDVRLADPLRLRELGHPVPRQLGVGQVVPARVVEGLQSGRQRRADLALRPDQGPNRVTLRVAELDAPHRANVARLRTERADVPRVKRTADGRTRPCAQAPSVASRGSGSAGGGRGPRVPVIADAHGLDAVLADRLHPQRVAVGAHHVARASAAGPARRTRTRRPSCRRRSRPARPSP